ncbi:MAG: hypothetical protein HQL29_05810, partial [Candidatus Omnitrophica bacterium]|nr:hypothetical protein [Candidatus Omnitrophota bacterium]
MNIQKNKILFTTVITCLLVLFSWQAAFADVITTWPSGRIKSKLLDVPVNGVLYFEYEDDSFYGDNGTPGDLSDDLGRITLQRLQSPNAAGELTFTNTYYAGTDDKKFVHAYTDVNATAYFGSYYYDTDGTTLLSFTSANGTVREYYNSGNLMRKISANGDIFEYLNDSISGEWGKIILGYEALSGNYWTYDWSTVGGTQVTVKEYNGKYEPVSMGATQSDVDNAELNISYVYDHNGIYRDANDNDAPINQWILRSKTTYNADGSVKEIYTYDEYGRITERINNNTGTTTVYSGYIDANDTQYRLVEEYVNGVLTVTYYLNANGDIVQTVFASGNVEEWYGPANPNRL